MNANDSLTPISRAMSTHSASSERRYTVEVIATLTGVGPAVIRRYERAGLLPSSAQTTSPRWYTDRDLERVHQIRRLSVDLGMNLAAIEVILHMRERMLEMVNELTVLRGRV